MNECLNEKQKHIKALRKAISMAMNNNVSAQEMLSMIKELANEQDIPLANIQFYEGK